MIVKGYIFLSVLLLLQQSCVFIIHDKERKSNLSSTDSSKAYSFKSDSFKTAISKDTFAHEIDSADYIDTRNVQPQQIVKFAKTLIGVPYKYGSTDPAAGFDCSGFITYVFSHFGIIVPRSSIDFITVGKDVPVEKAMNGDLILFTGTDSTERFAGHIGLVVSNESGKVNFIHSTSGKKHGVTITQFNDYYKGRYLKTVRIFP